MTQVPETFGTLLLRRRMCRHFAAEAVDADVVTRLADAGLHGPSAGNTKAIHLLVLTTDLDRASFWQVAGAGRSDRWLTGMSAAPVLIMVSTSQHDYEMRYSLADKEDRLLSVDGDRAGFPAPWWWVDAGMAAMLILLAAAEEGLGACFFGLPVGRERAIAGVFEIPGDRSVAGVIAVGHPLAGESSGPSRTGPVVNRVHLGRWGREPGPS